MLMYTWRALFFTFIPPSPLPQLITFFHFPLLSPLFTFFPESHRLIFLYPGKLFPIHTYICTYTQYTPVVLFLLRTQSSDWLLQKTNRFPLTEPDGLARIYPDDWCFPVVLITTRSGRPASRVLTHPGSSLNHKEIIDHNTTNAYMPEKSGTTRRLSLTNSSNMNSDEVVH
jgi:hypothetical protein